MRGKLRKIREVVSGEVPGGDDHPGTVDKKASRMDPHSIRVRVWRHTVRAPGAFQATVTRSPINWEDRTGLFELELRMALAVPKQDEHLPDQIGTIFHQTGLEARRRPIQALSAV
jgi:hypothetical protein